jgi:hypothetical protein
MQVLPGHVIRNAGRASRLLGAKTFDIEERRRRAAVARWRHAMHDGLDAGQAVPAAGQWLDARTTRRSRAAEIRLSVVRQGQARSDPAQGRLRRLRCLRQMDRGKALRAGHSRQLPQQGRRRDAVAHQGHPDRRRLRVMEEFETASANRNIPLHVLPPRSPKLNGAVERCYGAWRYEFYTPVNLPTQID